MSRARAACRRIGRPGDPDFQNGVISSLRSIRLQLAAAAKEPTLTDVLAGRFDGNERISRGRRTSSGLEPSIPPLIRLLTYTTIYPSSALPLHGVMVENRLRELLASDRLEARVVAPVPWFPSGAARFGRYAKYNATPPHETRHGTSIAHPRYLVVPKVGVSAAPALLAAGTYRAVAKQASSFDLIDAHYFYPDGVAATLIAARLGKPVVITARGTDVNVLPNLPIPRRWIRWAARRCDAIITVSSGLRDALLELDIGPKRIDVLRNGVDLTAFAPLEREDARRQLGWAAGKTLVCVAKLDGAKGQDLAISALRDLPEYRLVLVGQGPMLERYQTMAREIGVADRVTFMGAVPHGELARLYSAADASILASAREGMPNVVLESLACGTPVVATQVGGIGEILNPDVGVMLEERSVPALVAGIRKLFSALPARETVRRHAETLDWKQTVDGQLALYRDVLEARRSNRPLT